MPPDPCIPSGDRRFEMDHSRHFADIGRWWRLIRNTDALANIEQWAIDLAWDIIARFSDFSVNGEKLLVEFFLDWAKVRQREWFISWISAETGSGGDESKTCLLCDEVA